MSDNDNIIRDIKFGEKKVSERPADPVATPASPVANPGTDPAAQITLTPFPDGNIFKFTNHPKTPGQFILFDSANVPVAVFGNPYLANLVCDAVKMLFAAAALAKADSEAAQAPAAPAENVSEPTKG